MVATQGLGDLSRWWFMIYQRLSIYSLVKLNSQTAEWHNCFGEEFLLVFRIAFTQDYDNFILEDCWDICIKDSLIILELVAFSLVIHFDSPSAIVNRVQGINMRMSVNLSSTRANHRSISAIAFKLHTQIWVLTVQNLKETHKTEWWNTIDLCDPMSEGGWCQSILEDTRPPIQETSITCNCSICKTGGRK